MEFALVELLPKLLRQGVQAEVRQFQCKNELVKQLPQRLAGYAQWLPETAMVVVLVDRDDDDCFDLKARLERMANDAGLSTRQTCKGAHFRVVNRIAIEELEAWFFGDWPAVRAAYPKVKPTLPQQAGFRDPDAIRGGTWEALERELQKRGYFRQGLRKLELSRAIARHMDITSNRSRSFQAFRDALARF